MLATFRSEMNERSHIMRGCNSPLSNIGCVYLSGTMHTIMPLSSEVQMFRWLISKLQKPSGNAGHIDAASPFSIDQSALADFVRLLREADADDLLKDSESGISPAMARDLLSQSEAEAPQGASPAMLQSPATAC
jgi:hypothetical protein